MSYLVLLSGSPPRRCAAGGAPTSGRCTAHIVARRKQSLAHG
jgi:hypothetical protein